jgi:very-short-patch-repair endonuclease
MPGDRIDALLTRLLDLSLRNRLLNFRATRQSMAVAVADLDALCSVEDAVASESRPWLRLRATGHPDDPEAQRAQLLDDLRRGVLRLRTPAERCAADSIELFRRAHRTLDETGANPLYLAVGTLEHRDPDSGQSGRAPLVLVPLEIERISRTEGCRVRRAEADITLNAALVEFLRQRHRLELGISDLPEDESGIDLRAILSLLADRVAAMDGWRVHHEAHVACLDFRKWPIWTDLRDRRAAIAAHPVVGTVLERRGTPAALGHVALEEVDPVQLALPLACDGSQLAAVLAAGQRRSFVLQGPPGTGKSQTITNLVSHAIAGGMRVLFVAEKQVALDVVARRLRDGGLGPWMLDLHPERCGRAEFVAQVKEAWEALEGAPRSAADPSPAPERASLAALREATAAVRPSGHSAYSAAARITALCGEAGTPTIDLSATVDAGLAKVALDRMLAAAQAAADAAQAAADGASLAEHPLRDLVQAEQLRTMAATAAALRTAYERSVPVASKAAAAAGGPAWSAMAEQLRTDIAAVVRSVRAAEAFRADGRLEESALAVDPAPILADLRTRGARFWPLGWLARRAIARALAVHAPRPIDSSRASLESALALIAESRAANAGAADAGARMARVAGVAANDAAGAQRALEALEAIAPGAGHPKTAGEGAVEPVRVLQDAVPVLRLAAADLREPRLEEMAERAGRWQDAQPRLRAWLAWRAAVRAAEGMGLGPAVTALADGTLTPAHAVAATERAALWAWLRSLRAQSVPLKSCDPATVDRMAAAYERAFAASRSSVGGRAAAAVRTRFAALESSGAAGVRDQLARLAELRALQRPRRSIRTLIRQTSTPLAALKPVVLASPLSAAMHLDPDLPPFDLVVFDEASQVPLADAIGALSRAGSAIVVGDSKQLPPTTFFDAAGGGDDPGAGTAAGTEAEEESGFEELESVLDEFVASRFPELMLRWHYRSRDERLIAFSNAAIYGGKLQTFPCAFRTHPNLGIGMRAVPGAYDRARTRTNPAEARAVVDELAARLRSADATPANRSLGVVAFSLAQQSAIQDLFDELVDGDDAVRATVAGLEEPVLIKNLESIQGDERATMLFSVGYGRDESGRMAMNFGPMNRAGGERRLNVAITRAREQMLVFSTIRASDIDLARSGASGVRLLRDFLEFAERGTLMPAASAAGGGQCAAAHAGRPDALEESIARALESRGWTVDRHVGTSGYRVSLALRDRTHPERWCLGIELDGPFWQSGETVADRELLRRDVLRRLGWQTIRVWSAEWLGDAAKAIERIEAAAACRRT